MGDGNVHHCVHPDPESPDNTIHVAAPAQHPRLRSVPESRPASDHAAPTSAAVTQQFVKQVLEGARDAAWRHLDALAKRSEGQRGAEGQSGSGHDASGNGGGSAGGSGAGGGGSSQGFKPGGHAKLTIDAHELADPGVMPGVLCQMHGHMVS
jgi:hypothetical protein